MISNQLKVHGKGGSYLLCHKRWFLSEICTSIYISSQLMVHGIGGSYLLYHKRSFLSDTYIYIYTPSSLSDRHDSVCVCVCVMERKLAPSLLGFPTQMSWRSIQTQLEPSATPTDCQPSLHHSNSCLGRMVGLNHVLSIISMTFRQFLCIGLGEIIKMYVINVQSKCRRFLLSNLYLIMSI